MEEKQKKKECLVFGGKKKVKTFGGKQFGGKTFGGKTFGKNSATTHKNLCARKSKSWRTKALQIVQLFSQIHARSRICETWSGSKINENDISFSNNSIPNKTILSGFSCHTPSNHVL